MRSLLCHGRAKGTRKVSAWIFITVLAFAACDRPTPQGPAPGRRTETARTPRTRANTGVKPPPTVDEPQPIEGVVTLSLAAGGHVMDCRAGEYHPAMQAAPAASAAALRCGAEGDGLVLQARSGAPDAPAVTVATIRAADDAIALRWNDDEFEMMCSPAASFDAWQKQTCPENEQISLTGMTLRRTWP